MFSRNYTVVMKHNIMLGMLGFVVNVNLSLQQCVHQ